MKCINEYSWNEKKSRQRYDYWNKKACRHRWNDDDDDDDSDDIWNWERMFVYKNVMVLLFIMHNLPRNYLKPVSFFTSLYFSKTIQRNIQRPVHHRYHLCAWCACIVNEVFVEYKRQRYTQCMCLRLRQIHSTFNQLWYVHNAQYTIVMCQFYCMQTFAFCPHHRMIRISNEYIDKCAVNQIAKKKNLKWKNTENSWIPFEQFEVQWYFKWNFGGDFLASVSIYQCV